MIICGYLTIGKTTLAKDNLKIVDLDSKPFSEIKSIYSDWYKIYGDIALDLEQQGYIVLVSTNFKVIEYLSNKAQDLFVVLYSNSLREYALKKAKDRPNTSLTTLNAIESNFYKHNNKILCLCEDREIKFHIINDTNYSLKDIVDKIK